MLPFSDIDFFLFAAGYVGLIWLFKFFLDDKQYSIVTFIITAFYLFFYYKYSYEAIGYGILSFIYIQYLSKFINHKLINSIVLAIPMVLLKVHLNPGFIFFAGSSFVTFRSIQVFLDKKPEDKINFIGYFNFLFFIPALLIGPLDRFKRFSDNAQKGFSSITIDQVVNGWQEFVKGILYKFIIAEFVSRYWLNGSGIEAHTSLYYINDIYAYAIFLFFDFAGYSSMAVGMAKMIGINLPFNFNAPFLSVNPPDFWQRWHASLTNWLTDYVFKPFYKYLSGKQDLKKYPVTKQNLAIFLTLFIMGCWNGFEPNFIYSGMIYGLFSVIHNIYVIECRKKDKDVVFGNMSPQLIKYISIFVMFNLACVALYIFSGRYL
jgi:membrane protein involved in D-alanine export